ncbi:MAG: MFS transporter [Myxococcales bacterium]|nr:MFS transporter [Myxococcales bacterium]
MSDDVQAPPPLPRRARVWRWRVLIATWLCYAGFYFCRKNFSIAKSAILGKLEVSTSALAHVFTAYLVAYMLGQFATGVLSRRIPTRRLLLGGMVLSLVCNVGIGIAYSAGPGGYWPMMMLMIVNGLAQSTGWPGNVGVLSNWLRRHERGRMMAGWATSYQIGSIFAKAFAAFMLGFAGPAWSFHGAAIVLAAICVFFYFNERDRPEDVGLDPIVVEPAEVVAAAEAEPSSSVADKVRQSGLFRGWSRRVVVTVLLMGATYFVFKFLRYALDSWAPLVIERIFKTSKVDAGYISTTFDMVGFVGVLVSGWVSDRFFKGRRYQTILIMTIGMLVMFLALALVGMRSVTLFAVCLSLCGFMLMGPDSLLSGTGAIDVGGPGGAAAAAGLINGIGSIGPIFQEEMIGVMLGRYGHMSAFYLMVGVSVVGVIGTSYLALRSKRRQSAL